MSQPSQPTSPSGGDLAARAAQAAQALRRGRERHAAGAYVEAAAYFREAVALREGAFGSDDPRTLDAVRHEAAALAALGDLDGSAERQARALDGARDAAARARAKLAEDAAALARLRGRQRAWNEAAALWLVVLRERRATAGPDDPGTLAALAQLATTWQSAGRFRRAERAWRRLLEAREAAGAAPADLAAVRERIADCLAGQEQRGEALALRLRALGERSTPAPPDATRVVRPHPDDPPESDAETAAPAAPAVHLPPAVADEPIAGETGRSEPRARDGTAATRLASLLRWPDANSPARTQYVRRVALGAVLLVVTIGALAIAGYERERTRREAERAAQRREELAPPRSEQQAPPSLGAPSTEVYQPQ